MWVEGLAPLPCVHRQEHDPPAPAHLGLRDGHTSQPKDALIPGSKAHPPPPPTFSPCFGSPIASDLSPSSTMVSGRLARSTAESINPRRRSPIPLFPLFECLAQGTIPCLSHTGSKPNKRHYHYRPSLMPPAERCAHQPKGEGWGGEHLYYFHLPTNFRGVRSRTPHLTPTTYAGSLVRVRHTLRQHQIYFWQTNNVLGSCQPNLPPAPTSSRDHPWAL
ncbi:hypothetical protein BHE74_00014971 [Ensete ventricosum]|nr:hypothetical protein GW17_00054690 [Ensete ventricosum]RWW76912.1 hypothetical protein BHE74_00014971 [Ensete ventricosum]